MDHAIEIARLREFIAHKALDTEFAAFVIEHDRRVAEAGKPELEVPCNFMRRRSDDEMINITPWLRSASLEDACRFARLAHDEHDAYDSDDEDVQFLAAAILPCLDEEQVARFHRAHNVRVMLYDIYGLHARIRRLMPDIRPADHEKVVAHIIRAKGPMGPRDDAVVEEAGTLL